MANKNSLPGGSILPLPAGSFYVFTWLTQKLAAAIIAVTALVFYSVSIRNEYALDDGIIIHQNDHVLKGVKGIGGIMSLDAYESFYRRMCATDQLAGGRYRPLSVVTFALEQEILGTYRTGLYSKTDDSNRNGVLDHGRVNYITSCGRPETNYEYNRFIDVNGDGLAQPAECPQCWDTNMNFSNDRQEDLNSDGIINEVDCQLYGASFRHFNNIWLYALGCVLLYIAFARHLLRHEQDIAFVAALLFTIHPIHSEAVANVKSRDEILSLIFISLTFIFTFRFIGSGNRKDIFGASLALLLALLSKEYAVMMLMLVPLAVYTFTVNPFSWTNITGNRNFRSAVVVVAGFIACAVIMTYIKRTFDIHALPGARPVRSYWLLPFFYLAALSVAGSFRSGRFNVLMAWLFFVVLLYVGMRWNAVKLKPSVPNNEILNNPFLLADGAERFCTKGFILLKYLMLLVFPRTLSSDYSFDTIAYRDFTSWDFWVSVLLHVSLVVATVMLVKRKHLLGFAACTYILFLLMVANIVMDIGATMGERLIFHASIGFCMAAAFFVVRGAARIKNRWPVRSGIVAVTLLLVVTILSGIKTWERNFDWKNDITLFLKDVQTNPNSVLCLGNAGARYVDLLSTEDFSVTTPAGYDTAFNDQNGTLRHIVEEVQAGKYSTRREAGIHHGIAVLERALALHPRYVNGYLNLGLLHMQLGNDFEAIYNFKNVERLYPNNPYLESYYRAFEYNLYSRANAAAQNADWGASAKAWKMLTIIRPRHAEAWFNLGVSYFNQQKIQLAGSAWQETLKVQPDHKEANRLLQVVRGGSVQGYSQDG